MTYRIFVQESITEVDAYALIGSVEAEDLDPESATLFAKICSPRFKRCWQEGCAYRAIHWPPASEDQAWIDSHVKGGP